jgi:hypothetical protein
MRRGGLRWSEANEGIVCVRDGLRKYVSECSPMKDGGVVCGVRGYMRGIQRSTRHKTWARCWVGSNEYVNDKVETLMIEN